MYTLKVLGIRRNVLAYHRLETQAELREMMAVYAALGYASEALVVEEHEESKAA